MTTPQFLKPLIHGFMVLAAAGFMGTLMIYLGALANQDKLDRILSPWLVPGLFVVWFPTIFVMSRMTRFGSQKDIWKIALSGCPLWLRRALYGVIGFGIINFAYFALMQKHESVAPAFFMGGHFMIFYGIAFCIMYSALHAPALLATRRCSLGHIVSPLAAYCPTCGKSVTEQIS